MYQRQPAPPPGLTLGVIFYGVFGKQNPVLQQLLVGKEPGAVKGEAPQLRGLEGEPGPP